MVGVVAGWKVEVRIPSSTLTCLVEESMSRTYKSCSCRCPEEHFYSVYSEVEQQNTATTK